ncbi:MAG TPA: hypothetical protein PK668_09835 [Myxococcota bacterium]|nr:hypothetical protein [Myxococcota bacterium]HRY93535.1 hypothetical protein [Myxococcota bacterium]
MRHMNVRALAVLGLLLGVGAGCDETRFNRIETQKDTFLQDGTQVVEQFIQDGTAKVDTYAQTGFHQVDAFVQKAAAEVDILWVVDNSPSMLQEQQNLGDNFTAFIGYIDTSLIDYHIGVIAMDMEDPTHQGKLVGTTKVITRQTPGAAAVFEDNINVGTTGGGFEMGILAAHDALSEPLLSGANAGFLRDTASLAVIFVSDEDDHSYGGVTYYKRFFTTLKDVGNERRVIMAAIVGENPDGCSGAAGEAAPGARYLELVQALGGSSASICAADFSVTLSQLGLTVAGLGRKFVLSQAPDPSSIVVRVRAAGAQDWVEITESPATGWRLDQGENAIYFDGSYVPPPEADIEVEYSNSQYEFPMSGRGDPETLVVTVDADGDGPGLPVTQTESTDYVYDAASNTIRFLDGHVPPLGATVEISYASLRRSFALGQEVENPETLRVDVDLKDGNGYRQVLRDEATGWLFDSAGNAVLFQGNFVPPLGSDIRVSFSNLRWLFPLTRVPVSGTLVVTLDNDGDGPLEVIEVPVDDPAGAPGYIYYGTTEPAPYTNSISFEKLEWPPLGAVVTAVYRPSAIAP